MATVNLQPGSTGLDAYIVSSLATTNFGTQSTIEAGRRPTGSLRRSLIQFDLSSIPSGATVTDAFLRLTVSDDTTTVDADRNVSIYRLLVDWVETQVTWNIRKTSTNWNTAGASGSGTDRAASPTDTQAVGSGGTVDWDVTTDVANFVSGAQTNNGWILIGAESTDDDLKRFFSSDAGGFRPLLSVTFGATVDIVGATTGTSSVSGTLSASGNLIGSSTGQTSVNATLLSNEYIDASAAGSSSATATLFAIGHLVGSIAGSSTASGDIQGEIFLSPGSASGTTSISADIKGIYYLVGSSENTSQASASGSFEGQLRGTASGITLVAEATGYAKAVGVTALQDCYPLPLFYITNGSLKNNGQQDLLDLISDRFGYRLNDWVPAVAQFKDGGRWANSPTAQGRRLKSYVFDNAVEILDLNLVGYDQNKAIQFMHDLWRFQQAAADYWSSAWASLPVYLVSRAARETNTRYAIIHQISCPQLKNLYALPFFDNHQAVFDTITVRIERGHWSSTPPGEFECVPISSIRSWTVAGWQSGS